MLYDGERESDGDGGEQRSDGSDCRKNGVWRSVVCFLPAAAVKCGKGMAERTRIRLRVEDEIDRRWP